jgi:hypothetical protein
MECLRETGFYHYLVGTLRGAPSIEQDRLFLTLHLIAQVLLFLMGKHPTPTRSQTNPMGSPFISALDLPPFLGKTTGTLM